MSKIIRALPLLILLTLSEAAYAAYPFCIVRNNSYQECIYDSVDTCNKNANPNTNTYCVVSEEAIITYSGFARYCTVDSNLVALCNYNDRRECNSAARSLRSLCIDREVRQDDVDPYRFDDRIQR